MIVNFKRLQIRTDGLSAILIDRKTARVLDLQPLDRVVVKSPDSGKETRAAVAFWDHEGEHVGLLSELAGKIEAGDEGQVDIIPVAPPTSVGHIQDKMNGMDLTEGQVFDIIQDVVDDKLSQIEVASFLTAVTMGGTSQDEIYYLTKAIAETGDMVKIDSPVAADKHCSGSVPGNRTTPIIVPILASLGIKMPKSSSRAITSAAGTADVMEVFCNVAFSKPEIIEMVDKSNGCVIWGGGLNIVPSDSKLIKVRKPLKTNPEGLVISSILSKKYALGATHVLLDLPLGLETRYKHIGEVKLLERLFISIAAKLGMKADVMISYGDEPVGKGIGPVLEARDCLWILNRDERRPRDLEEKALEMSARLLNLIEGKPPNYRGNLEKVTEVLESKQALEKFWEIVKNQGGQPNVTSDSLDELLASETFKIKAGSSGRIIDLLNPVTAKLARLAGCPKNKGAGIYFHKKYGETVQTGDLLATVYSGSAEKKQRCEEYLLENPIAVIE